MEGGRGGGLEGGRGGGRVGMVLVLLHVRRRRMLLLLSLLLLLLLLRLLLLVVSAKGVCAMGGDGARGGFKGGFVPSWSGGGGGERGGRSRRDVHLAWDRRRGATQVVLSIAL